MSSFTRIIAISGRKGSGKSTAADFLASHIFRVYGHNFKVRPLARTIKEAASYHFKATIDELEVMKRTDPKIREWMVKYGDDMRAEKQSFFVDELLETAKTIGERNLIVPDVRYPDEIANFMRFGGVKLVLLRIGIKEETLKARGLEGFSTCHSESSIESMKALGGVIELPRDVYPRWDRCQSRVQSVDNDYTLGDFYLGLQDAAKEIVYDFGLKTD